VEGFTRIGRTEDFRDRKPKNVSFEGIDFVVVKVGGGIFAFENNCPHQHFSMLHQGLMEGCSITCPMHGWTFDLTSGKSTNGDGHLERVEVRISDGWVWLGSKNNEKTYSLFDGN